MKCNYRKKTKNHHTIDVVGGKGHYWDSGTTMLEPFEMTAGEERTIILEMDWRPRQKTLRDASVVVWGFDGEVTLVHRGGILSSSFREIPHEGDQTILT